MEVFKFTDYKEFILARVKAMPRNGHGQFMKMAKHVGAHPVVVTQVLKGSRDFSEEQAFRLTDFFGLNSAESEYFMRLVAMSKAGSHDLKRFHRESLATLKRQAESAKQRIAEHRTLDDSTKSVFYSDWIYGAVRLLTSIEEFRTSGAIAEHLGIGLARVNELLEFLVSVGLVKREKDKLSIGIASTHLDARSRFVNNHHRNWRIKGLEALNSSTPDDLFFTGPCTISLEDFSVLRKELIDVVASMTKKVPKSDPQVLACMNMDWFKL